MSRVRTGREWVLDVDPETLLTPRQRQVLDAVRSYGGDRSRAARALGMTPNAVWQALRCVGGKGITIPPAVVQPIRMTPRRQAVIDVVRRHGGNQTAAARELGITHGAVHRHIAAATLLGVPVPAPMVTWSRRRRIAA